MADDKKSGPRARPAGTRRPPFAKWSVKFLGNRRWRLSCLLRGRGGTEAIVGAHQIGETFVLLDGRHKRLDPAQVTSTPGTEIVALGRGDSDPVVAQLAMQGITLRPLSPVHPQVALLADGSLRLAWTRRARGAWRWLDGVDTPLHEETELYRVTYGPPAAPIAEWSASIPELTVPATTLADLQLALSPGSFHVSQQGSYALSDPLHLTDLP